MDFLNRSTFQNLTWDTQRKWRTKFRSGWNRREMQVISKNMDLDPIEPDDEHNPKRVTLKVK